MEPTALPFLEPMLPRNQINQCSSTSCVLRFLVAILFSKYKPHTHICVHTHAHTHIVIKFTWSYIRQPNIPSLRCLRFLHSVRYSDSDSMMLTFALWTFKAQQPVLAVALFKQMCTTALYNHYHTGQPKLLL